MPGKACPYGDTAAVQTTLGILCRRLRKMTAEEPRGPKIAGVTLTPRAVDTLEAPSLTPGGAPRRVE